MKLGNLLVFMVTSLPFLQRKTVLILGVTIKNFISSAILLRDFFVGLKVLEEYLHVMTKLI